MNVPTENWILLALAVAIIVFWIKAARDSGAQQRGARRKLKDAEQRVRQNAKSRL